MFSSTRCLAYLTTILAVAAGACSAPEARPALAAAAPVECAGGSVQSAADAARYAGCEAIVGDLRITGSDLTDLASFSELRRVSGSLVVADNAKLISLAGLKGLERVRAVEIRNNPRLSAYYGVLPQLQQVEGSLVLRSNRGMSKREVRQVLDRVTVGSEVAVASDSSASL